jgi:MFS family permease
MRRGRGARRLLIDLTPVRRSRDLRCLVLGQLISVFGTQLTTVAVPYQVYQLTRSSLDVGLVSLAQLFPLIAGSLLGGSVVDATGVGGPAPLPTSAKPSSKPTSAVT